MAQHTVEKIGGTSMTRFGELMKNILIAGRKGPELYNRVFVVSAYGGVTNLLLENKKTAEPGIFAAFAAGDRSWADKLESTRAELIRLNRTFESLGLRQDAADDFVNERMDGVKSCLRNLMQLRSFGHFHREDYLPAARELLSSVGEAHSAFNSTLILREHGVNAVFVDLSGWMSPDIMSLNEAILSAFKDIEFDREMPIVTGYVKYDEGIMKRFDRGYSEITFSKIAVLTDAKEGIIHKEFHLSTGDPKLIGVDKVQIIGNTNFDIADQLSDMDMEAIHSKAAKEMEMKNIPIRIKNAFDPEHPGTLISRDYISPAPRVEMICFFNLTAGLPASAIFDSDVKIKGQTAPKYALSATGEGLKMLSRAQRGATAVKTVNFSENPQVSTQKQGKIATLYGYLFDGPAPKLLLINLAAEAQTVSVDGLGFTPASFEQISSSSPETPVTGPSSLDRLSRKVDASKQLLLRPHSITVVQ